MHMLTGLNSALGVSDGRVYEALWQCVQMDPMNKDEVTPAYAVCGSLMFDDDSLSGHSHIFDLRFNADKLWLRRRENFKASSEPTSVTVHDILTVMAIVPVCSRNLLQNQKYCHMFALTITVS